MDDNLHQSAGTPSVEPPRLARTIRRLLLATVIIAVVALCAYTIPALYTVSLRKQWLYPHYRRAPFNEPYGRTVTLVHGDPAKGPTIRRLIGDHFVPDIEILKNTPESEIQELHELFPESDIFYVPDRPENQRN